MFLSTAKKALQFTGIVADDLVIYDDQYDPDSIVMEVAKPAFVEPKGAGSIAAFTHDPSKDLEILTPLFGVYKGKHYTLDCSCPACGRETQVGNFPARDAAAAYLDELEGEDGVCEECGEEASAYTFYDNIKEIIATSADPTDEQVLAVASPLLCHASWYIDETKKMLKWYFCQLSTDIEQPVDIMHENYLSQNDRLIILGLHHPEPVEKELIDEEECSEWV